MNYRLARDPASFRKLNETELRIITLPDGRAVPFTLPRWMWIEHDFVVGWFQEKPDPAAWMVKLAWDDHRDPERPFGKLYPVVIQHVANVIRSSRPETLPTTQLHGRA